MGQPGSAWGTSPLQGATAVRARPAQNGGFPPAAHLLAARGGKVHGVCQVQVGAHDAWGGTVGGAGNSGRAAGSAATFWITRSKLQVLSHSPLHTSTTHPPRCAELTDVAGALVGEVDVLLRHDSSRDAGPQHVLQEAVQLRGRGWSVVGGWVRCARVACVCGEAWLWWRVSEGQARVGYGGVRVRYGVRGR
jgi:hypothetical protein